LTCESVMTPSLTCATTSSTTFASLSCAYDVRLETIKIAIIKIAELIYLTFLLLKNVKMNSGILNFNEWFVQLTEFDAGNT
jgi:hypothetical protein